MEQITHIDLVSLVCRHKNFSSYLMFEQTSDDNNNIECSDNFLQRTKCCGWKSTTNNDNNNKTKQKIWSI